MLNVEGDTFQSFVSGVAGALVVALPSVVFGIFSVRIVFWSVVPVNAATAGIATSFLLAVFLIVLTLVFISFSLELFLSFSLPFQSLLFGYILRGLPFFSFSLVLAVVYLLDEVF